MADGRRHGHAGAGPAARRRGLLREGADTARAAELLWLTSSSAAFDLLAADRGRAPEHVADPFLAMPEQNVLR